MAVQPRAGRWTRRFARQLAPRAGEAGLTLIELIVAFSLMLILSTMAVPVARVKVQREKERRLRSALTEIRVAIDRYKDMADEGKLGQVDPDNHGYPRSLEELVEGVEIEVSPGGLPTGGMGSQRPGIGLEPSRSLGTRPNPMGGIGSRGPSGSRTGTGGTFENNRLGSDRSQQGAFGTMGEDPLERTEDQPQAIRFLRSIPVDPMTGRSEWGLLSVSDNPEGRSWSGRNVFDVYSLSQGTALDGTRYSEW